MNQNKILKNIAEKLGANVTTADNDTNELLALIEANIPAGGSTGGSKLYMHNLKLNVPRDANTQYTSVEFTILTNFSTVLTDSNIVSLLHDYYHSCCLYNRIFPYFDDTSMTVVDISLGSISVAEGETYVNKNVITITCRTKEQTGSDSFSYSSYGATIYPDGTNILVNTDYNNNNTQGYNYSVVESDDVTPL